MKPFEKNCHLPCIIENFLETDKCKQIIDTIRSLRVDGGRTIMPVRHFYEKGLSQEAMMAHDIRSKAVEVAINALNPPFQVWPDYTIYQGNYEGDYHPRHSDNSRFNIETDSWEPNHTPHRKITIGIYLNNCGVDYYGGELCFPALGLVLKPNAGTLICYYSDERFEHEVKTVTSGERYSMLLWLTDNTQFVEPPIFPLQ